MPISCEKMENLIARLIDDELQDSDKDNASAHIAVCSSCRQKYELQKALKQRVARVVLSDKAPVHLRARIRRDIHESRVLPGFIRSLSQVFSTYKLKGAVATAAVLMIIAVPYTSLMVQQRENRSAAESSSARYITVQGKILCVDCEAIKAAGHKAVCEADHHLGLRDDDGRVWSFVNAEQGKEIIHDFSLLNQVLEVEGYALPGALESNISVQNYRKL